MTWEELPPAVRVIALACHRAGHPVSIAALIALHLKTV